MWCIGSTFGSGPRGREFNSLHPDLILGIHEGAGDDTRGEDDTYKTVDHNGFFFVNDAV